MQQQSCPDCGLSETFHFIAEAGGQVCSNCGATSHDLQVFEPTTFHELAYALGTITDRRNRSSFQGQVGPPGRYLWSTDLHESRRLNQLWRKPEVDARIQGTLATLGYPGLFEQVDFLFQRARDESWKTSSPDHAAPQSLADAPAEANSPWVSVPSSLVARRIRWGTDSLLLATACCYAVLRREGICIDLETVSESAQLPYPKVKRAFKWLRLLAADAVRNIKLANPDPYLGRILAFLSFLSHSSPSALSVKVAKFLAPLRETSSSSGKRRASNANAARLSFHTQLEAIEATALDLCAFWWAKRTSSAHVPPQLAAFAIVVLAIEAHLKTPAPILEIFRYTHQAVEFDPTSERSGTASTSQLVHDDPSSKNAIEYYKELCAALKLQASKIPWLTDLAPTPRPGRPKKASRSGSLSNDDARLSGMTDWARRDLIIHTLDVLDVWRTTSSDRRPQASLQNQQSSKSHASTIDATIDPTIDSRPIPSEAPKQPEREPSPAQAEQEDESDLEMDESEFDCFASKAQGPARTATCLDDEVRAEESDASEGDAGGTVWRRIRSRLEAAGVLERPADNNHLEDGSVRHPLDLLTDDQVDALLFDANELALIFRSDPVELAALERAKVAAGDWPAKSDHQRNAEFAAFAESVARDRSPARPVERSTSDAPSVTGSIQPKRKLTGDRKRKSRSADPTVAPLQPPSPSRGKRARVPSSVVLLEQEEEESDWSD